LVKQLIEYKKFKDAAALLEEQADRQLTRLPRTPMEMPAQPDLALQPLRKVELWDLVSAFGRLMRETTALQPSYISIDETPIQLHMDRIVDLLKQHECMALSTMFTPPHTRGRLLGLFLATLELIKGNIICVEQPDVFGELWLRLAEAAPEQPVAAYHQDGLSPAREE
jgi:segregation and condensation protein A